MCYYSTDIIFLLALVSHMLHAVECGTPPDLDNGIVQASSTVFGGVANYMCNTGYRLESNDSQRICMGNGKWSNEDIECQTQPGIIFTL